jgi:lipopolysaccharide/colanic/teichoic acid biosynthesis glycosyltransferase
MRRLIDILAAVVVLLALSPVLIVIAIAVVIDSPGGPFYFAPRAGRNGEVFLMWKFRTMVAGAAALGPITGRNDPRITRLGNLLRRTKLDELPQFVNVLLGHMTLVGPRPENPEIVARYTPDQRAVLAVKPGITGRVQLDSKEESEEIPEGVEPEKYYLENLLEPKLLADLEYLRTRTPLTDARIILDTAGFVLRNSLFTTRHR